MEAQEYLASCACPEYLRKAERRLAEEVERCVNYLDPSSEPKITAVVEQELIRKQVRQRVLPAASTTCEHAGRPSCSLAACAAAAGHDSAV